MKIEHQTLFTSMKIGSVSLKNRYSMAPMGTLGCVDGNGAYNQRGIEYYVARARGGVGLIITGVQMVENEIEQFPIPSLPCPTYNPTAYIRSAKELTERVHAYDTKIFAQLTAGWGRACIPGFTNDNGYVAPSSTTNRFDSSIKHRSLTTEEVHYYIHKFIESAVIVQKAGFDGVEIHALHEGYLLDQFSLEIFNQRTDEYGGNFENRYRMAAEILQGIKAACGKDFAVSLRYSLKSNMQALGQGILPGEQALEIGRDIDEGLIAAKYLADIGYDMLNVDAGTYDSWYWNHPANYFEPGMYIPYCKAVKEVVDIPVLMAGRMDNPDLAAQSLENNICDGISLGRPLLADPEIVNKIKRGAFSEIRPCLSCHMGCLGRMANVGNICCAVNPACGREKEYQFSPAVKLKKVIIIGGGVAGMEAARIAAQRGHKVTLFEKSNELGGNVIAGSKAPFKYDDKVLLEWYRGEMQRNNVSVKYNVDVTYSLIKSYQPDTVIFATGSKANKPFWLPGVEQENVLLAEQVLCNIELISQEKITIIGAGLVGCETGLWLAQQGKDVTIVDIASDIIGGPHSICFANYQMLKELLEQHHVKVFLSTAVKEINKNIVVVQDINDEKYRNIVSEQVIIAIGYEADASLYEELKFKLASSEIYCIGDIKKARTIMSAIWDGYEVAHQL